MRTVALALAFLMILSVAPVQALDLTIPDALKGEQVAAFVPLEYEGFEDHLVKWDDLNAVRAYERDKTNDTIALVAWSLLLITALTLGHSGHDGADGAQGPPGPPGPPGGCK